MNIYPKNIKKNIFNLLDNLKININNKYNIKYIRHNKKGFTINKNNNDIEVYYEKDINIYNSILHILSKSETNYEENFVPIFENIGIMLDVARNAVINMETFKKYIMLLSLLGYNYLEIYLEDMFEINEEPKYGYMRGKYSQKDLKELDEFALNYGIELIPSIQTLAHLDGIFRHKEYHDVFDINDILLVGSEKTYNLIEKMLITIKNVFTTNKVNIGMDEAWSLGRGNYLAKNGYKDRIEIMKEHLQIVNNLCNKHNLKPKMWADMFFNLIGVNYHLESVSKIPKNIVDIVPKDVELIFWEYFSTDKSYYDLKFENMKQMTNNYSFAGGAVKWIGFAPHNSFTIDVLNSSFNSAKENNVKNFLLTAWADNGGEASHFSILPSLIYTQKLNYNKNILDSYSKTITNYSFDELLKLDLLNILYEGNEHYITNPSKYLLYEDLLIGDISQTPSINYNDIYKSHSKTLNELATRNSPFNYLFKTLYDLSKVLELKASLSVLIYNAYNKKDKNLLNKYRDDINSIIKNLKRFKESFELQWHIENKTYGFEIQNYRLGGLEERLKHINKRLKDYIQGNINKIDEIEERILEETTNTHYLNHFINYISPSKI